MEPNDEALTPAVAGRIRGSSRGRRKPASGEKRSLNLSLPEGDYERLAIHALRQRLTISDLVAKLAREHLREFHIARTAGRAGAPPAVEEA